ncbi:MAG: hypothetical protein B6242_16870 [Anaerolineaceae bacterium 4572_78]|nr:MAG: hypothetical protein B6242_16870 [Anaerolineaceae bacterium 4572_78]
MQSRRYLRVAARYIIGFLIITLAAGPLLSVKPVPFASGKTDETTYYFLTDHLGSVNVVLDEQGNVVERRDYLPYGQERAVHEELNVPETDYGFTGKELDSETGLNYYGARYYDPLIGRFVQMDPLLLNLDQMSQKQRNAFLSDPQNLNTYAYVQNNPVKYTDSTGLYKEDVHYDLTFFISMVAELSFNQSKTVAFHDQDTDNNIMTSPINPFATKKYHFVDRTETLDRIDNAIAESSLEAFGQALHSFQDTYSHGGYTPFTHIKAGDLPDLTHLAPEKALQMSEQSFRLLLLMNQDENGLGNLSQEEYNNESDRRWGIANNQIMDYLKLEDKSGSDIKKWADMSKKKEIVEGTITNK